MNLKTQLEERLKLVNATKQERMKLAVEIGTDSSKISILIDLMESNASDIGIRAAWVLEWICRENPELILKQTEQFTRNLENIVPDGSIRSAAKICEIISILWRKKPEKTPPEASEFSNRIVSACFKWLMGDFSIAAQAHSMQALYNLGHTESWIHHELKAELIQKYPSGSAGYKARARKILKLLQKSE